MNTYARAVFVLVRVERASGAVCRSTHMVRTHTNAHTLTDDHGADERAQDFHSNPASAIISLGSKRRTFSGFSSFILGPSSSGRSITAASVDGNVCI